MKNKCDRKPTNAEILYKIIYEILIFLTKIVELIFKRKLHATLFVIAFSASIMFFSANLKLADLVSFAKYLLTFF